MSDQTSFPGELAPGPLQPPAPPASEPLDVALALTAAIGGSLAIFAAYQVLLYVLVATFPQHFLLDVAMGQALGLLVPTLAITVIARRLGLLPAVDPIPRRVRPGAALGLIVWTSVVAHLLLAIVTSALAVLDRESLEQLHRWMSAMYEPLFRFETAWDVLSIVAVVSIVPAACEELLFRGYLQRVLRQRLGAGWSIAIAATLFSVMHVEPLGLLARLLLGVALGLAYERTGSLRLPMLLHALHNMASVLIMPWDLADEPLPQRTEALRALLGATPALGIAFFFWWRAARALPRAEAS